jgi:hypothetical protein
MSLLTDIAFAAAIRSNADLLAELPAGDVYNTSIALPDRDVENAPIPYVIVGFAGMQSDADTKDDDFEGESDSVQIIITTTAPTREKLGELMADIRTTVRDYFREHQGDTSDDVFAQIPDDMSVSASGVSYDPDKPCYWQELTYNCITKPD